MYNLSIKRIEKKRTAEITSQSGKRLNESKTQVTQCTVSGTVCEQKVLPVKTRCEQTVSNTEQCRDGLCFFSYTVRCTPYDRPTIVLSHSNALVYLPAHKIKESVSSSCISVRFPQPFSNSAVILRPAVTNNIRCI